ncbi:MAG: c-type cytochrome biogenesis protein CcmI [Azospirillaceae bacterium]|nr:c-type cytochrome biogenesis protein CcmI [Azospirillaceae bacterium]
MMFWVLVAALTVVTILALALPLLRPPAPTSRSAGAGSPGTDPALGVYRDQLREIERDIQQGHLAEDQARAARLEVAHRLLAADREAPAPVAPAPTGSGRRLALVLAVALPAAALAVYLPLGHPGLPSQPLADRDLAHTPSPARIEAAVARLAATMKAHPEDLQGWLLLGRSYGKMERYAEAADAMRHAATLAPDNAVVTSSFGEALVGATNGIVGDEARQAFETTLAHDPHDFRARYYLALAHNQAGDPKGALEGWTALAADSPADAPWLPSLRDDIRQVAQSLHLDPDAAIPKPRPADSAAETGGGPEGGAASPPGGSGDAGPGAADVAAAAAMTPDQRTQMIGAMVARLAARLKEQPDDADGWLKLGRAYTVLGQSDQAIDALDHASQVAPGRADALAALGEALQSRGDPGAAPSPRFLAVMRRLLAVAPDNRQALWFLGLDAAPGDPAGARALWQRLLAQLPPNSPDYAMVRDRLAALPKSGG